MLGTRGCPMGPMAAPRVAKGAQKPLIWSHFSHNFRHFNRSGAGWVHKGAQASQELLKRTLKPQNLLRKNTSICEEGPPTVNREVSGETTDENQLHNPIAKNCNEPCNPPELPKCNITSRCGGVASAFSILIYWYIVSYINHQRMFPILIPKKCFLY